MRVTATTGAAGRPAGALHAVELRDGKAVSYLRRESEADAGVFWHAGSVLALPEAGLPSRYSRFLEPEEFAGGADRADRVARASGGGRRRPGAVRGRRRRRRRMRRRSGTERAGGDLAAHRRVGRRRRRCAAPSRWSSSGRPGSTTSASRRIMSSSSSRRRRRLAGGRRASAVPFGWVPGCRGLDRRRPARWRRRWRWRSVAVRWFRLDPCLVTHVLGAYGGGRRRGGGGDGDADRAVRVPLRGARGGPAGRPVGLGRRPARDRPVDDRWEPRPCWSAGGSPATGSSGCRSTSGTSSIHGSTRAARVRPSATATASRWPGASSGRRALVRCREACPSAC